MSALDCVLVMPAYNEEGCIATVVKGWALEFHRQFGDRFRLVVVNDGSKDRTGAILDEVAKIEKRLIVIHQKNGGHGAALLAAYRHAVTLDSEYVFHVDSDDQFKPSDFGAFWGLRMQTKFLLGFRRKRHDALHRLVITRILRALLFFAYGTWIKDANVPYRLIQRRYLAAQLAVLPPQVFAPNIFLSVMAAKEGQNVVCMPVSHEERKTGVVSIVRWKLIKVCFRCVRELLEFRLNLGRNIARIRQLEKEAPAPAKAKRA